MMKMMKTTTNLELEVLNAGYYREECLENMFYQFEHGRISALKESAQNYIKAIDLYTKIACLYIKWDFSKDYLERKA